MLETIEEFVELDDEVLMIDVVDGGDGERDERDDEGVGDGESGILDICGSEVWNRHVIYVVSGVPPSIETNEF